MEDFKKFMTSKDKRFPCRASEFDSMALDFMSNSGFPTRGTRYVWLVNGAIRALYVSARIDVSGNADVASALQYKELWDRHLEQYNAAAFKNAKGAFHASPLWVKAESQGELITSTVSTLVILFVLAFLAMGVFTLSIALAFFVVAATTSVICTLFFFIIVVNGWDVGLIEVVALIYFIGYAMNYSLHIAYKYSSSEALVFEPPVDIGDENAGARLRRTTFAVVSIGGAVLGSAITTGGASFFLVFCKLTIFSKLGGMCLTVTVASVLIALGPVPAALMMFAPADPGCCEKVKKKAAADAEDAMRRIEIRNSPKAQDDGKTP